MTPDDLVGVLHDMYTNAEEGRQVAMIHLFGIRYSAELDNCGASASEIARLATGCKDYGREISKGRVLAEYVEIRRGVL